MMVGGWAERRLNIRKGKRQGCFRHVEVSGRPTVSQAEVEWGSFLLIPPSEPSAAPSTLPM